MSYLRTKVRDVGDVVTEQTSQEHAGEFVIGTSIGKFTIPLDVSGSQFSRQKVTQIICLDNVGYISDGALILSSSTISNVSGVSGTIAQDINELNSLLSSLSSSYINASGTIAQDINDLSSLVTSVSSSFVTTISVFSGSTASDISGLSQLLNTVSSSAASTTTQAPLISSSIASDINALNSSLNTSNNNIANLTASLNTTNNNVAALTASVLLTSQSIPTAAFEHRWDDIQGSFDQATGTSALTFETYKNGMQLLFMQYNQNDAFQMRFQMPHMWDVSTTVRVHGHFMPVSAPASPETVVFGWQAAWLVVNGTWPTTWTTGSTSLIVSGTMLDKHVAVSFVEMSPPTPIIDRTSAFLLFRLMRSGSSAEDTFVTVNPIGTGFANVALLGCDCHFRKSFAGSINEFNNG
jgi:hypothetical protein